MRQIVSAEATHRNRARKWRKTWQKIVRAMAAVVVFCTTYALILPAITMEAEVICGQEAHTHSEECYALLPSEVLCCSFTVQEDQTVIHSHSDLCYDPDGQLRCALPEKVEHIHEDDCYQEPELICEKEETEAHTHSDSCRQKKVLTCTEPESEGCDHEDDCATEERVLICTLEESEGHTHSDDCLVREQVLSCEMEEVTRHTHSDACTGSEKVLICTEEPNAHAHTEECYEARERICDLPEVEAHFHGENCYIWVEQDCTLEESDAHTHSDACVIREQVLNCELEETEGHTHSELCTGTENVQICNEETLNAHVHTDDCYEVREIVCELPEEEVHEHDENCYTWVEKPCTIEESEGHTHDESCYEVKTVPCETEDGDVHVHTDECYTLQKVDCEIPESEGHSHQSECYSEKRLICEQEEIQLHQHDENCFDEDGKLICTKQEVLEHQHTEACVQHNEEDSKILICQLEEHIHQDACYAQEEEQPTTPFVCGMGEHSHNDKCVDETGICVCSIPEHSHSASCIVEDLDLTKDLENSEIWDAMFDNVNLTGFWPEDLLAVANTQLGYQESKQNCVLEDVRLKGYTRYGDRYGMPYGDWSALFVRFCMEYADISYYPMLEENSTWTNPALWMEQLAQDGHLENAREYFPKAGDLVFLREEDGTAAERIGIVTAFVPESQDAAAHIQTIQGDVQDSVANVVYDLDDPRILGYGILPSGYAEVMQHSGEDYAITISLPREAKIPEWAEVSVREILPGTDEYETYYNQSVASLMEQLDTESEEALGVTFARFFDIGFYLNGRELEPAAPVSVQIQYAQPIAMTEDQSGKAVHFADDGIEILDAAVSGVEPLPEEEQQDQQVDTFSFTQDSFSVVGTVLSNARAATVTVWLDGTCGGLMAYEGSPNKRQELTNGVLPTTWDSPTRYAYTLKGWYDVTHNKYYAPGAVVDSNVTTNTVFYADWIAESYSTSQPNGHTVASLNTSDFITTYVFDYNVLFNMQSVDLSSSSADRNNHSETWRLVESGKVDYAGGTTLDFIFRDHDGSGRLSHPNIADGSSVRNEPNSNQLNAITTGIYTANLGDLLFNPGTSVIGKQYLGTGNYLYQYMEDPADEHYGYYYYDSFLNSATYNQNAGRFYIYDYLEYARDTIGNNLHDTNADFLPLNTPGPGVDLNGQVVYASQRNQEPNAITNFFFGIRSDIHFYLPNDAGATDDNGNYLNKSTTGDDMIFEFFGDDDVWILLDGKLLLDVGGIHQVRGGRIDFSRGVVYTTKAGSDTYESKTFEQILGKNNKVLEGPHDLTIYYLERGSSMSNCAIYFNLAPRYGLDLKKEDYVTGEPLENVTFQVFNDVNCTVPAKLWVSHDAAKNNATPVNTFTTGPNGMTHMWGLVAGKSYYIKETVVPDGYPEHDDLIRVTLNNHGTDISEVTVVRESNVKGYEVIYHSMDKENHLITVALTNKQEDDVLTALRVEKQWSEETVKEVPVQMYLMANGVRIGNPVTLSVDNAWGYTWMDLPTVDASGNPIQYTADEIHIPGYEKVSVEKSTLEADKISWIKVGALEDGATMLLALDSDTMLTANGNSFGSMTYLAAQGNTSAQWEASAYQDGFLLHCGTSYLTFDNSEKEFYLGDGTEGNRTFYYDGSQLFVMSDNNRYYVAGLNNGLAVSTAGDATGLYKKVVTKQGTTVYGFTNTSIPEEQQKALRIEKRWEGSTANLPERILVHLKKNGETVTTVELNPANNWSTTVAGLDGTLLLSGGYTLEEEVPFGYSSEVSQVQDISVDQWNWNSGQSGLVTGKTYVFTANGRALADVNGNLGATVYNDVPAANQQWLVVESALSDGSTIQVLKNVGTGKYLKEDYQNLYTVENADGQCKVRMRGGQLQYYPQSDGQGWCIRVGNSGEISVAYGTDSGTKFTLYEHEVRSEYLITVTNTYGVYVLPSTGGLGSTHYHTFGGLLILAAALMYLLKAVCRRQKGGR